MDAAPALVFSARPDGYIDYFNERWLAYLGVSRADLEGRGWTKLIHPDDLDEHVRRWEDAMSSGKPVISQARVRMANGEYPWMLHQTEAVRDQAGNIVRWFGTSIDIEPLKRVKRELKAPKDQLYKENVALRSEISQTSMFEEIVGSSTALRRVLVLVAKVAGTDSNVLITGETGTGKELIARAIHQRSARAAPPFVYVNCGAIAQLRVLQERSFERVGGAKATRLTCGSSRRPTATSRVPWTTVRSAAICIIG